MKLKPVKMTASKKVAPKKVWDEIRAEGEKYIEDLIELMRRNDENERSDRAATKGSGVKKKKGA